MRRGQTALVCILGGSLLAPEARAAAPSSGNTYQTIAVSNPFRLKPLPPPPTNPPVVEPPSNITLTGITTIFGDKLALMEVQAPNKPKTFLSLAEGARDGDVEVVSIDEVAGTVHINNRGIPQMLDFKTADKRQASAVPMARPANPAPVNPTAIPSLPVQPAPAAGNTVKVGSVIPPRPVRPSTAETTAIPTVTTLSVAGSPGVAAKPEKPMSIDDQVILMEINRELHKDDPKFPPLPPTPLTPMPPTPQ